MRYKLARGNSFSYSIWASQPKYNPKLHQLYHWKFYSIRPRETWRTKAAGFRFPETSLTAADTRASRRLLTIVLSMLSMSTFSTGGSNTISIWLGSKAVTSLDRVTVLGRGQRSRLLVPQVCWHRLKLVPRYKLIIAIKLPSWGLMDVLLTHKLPASIQASLKNLFRLVCPFKSYFSFNKTQRGADSQTNHPSTIFRWMWDIFALKFLPFQSLCTFAPFTLSVSFRMKFYLGLILFCWS